MTLAWNVVGVVVVLVAAERSASVALLGFGLDSGIEIFASVVVIRELRGTASPTRQRQGLRLIAWAFVPLATYLLVQTAWVLVAGSRARGSAAGITWLAVTCLAMFALASAKAVTGRALGNPVLLTESRVTLIDGLLAAGVLLGLLAHSWFGWWWADPVAGLLIVAYAAWEANATFTAQRHDPQGSRMGTA
jgi:divalent metal cation (Fe/Co/Zn/Cd) transporter